MDGGRLLRSFMAGFLPFRTATRGSSYVGQGIALVLIALSFLSPGNFFLTLIGVRVPGRLAGADPGHPDAVAQA